MTVAALSLGVFTPEELCAILWVSYGLDARIRPDGTIRIIGREKPEMRGVSHPHSKGWKKHVRRMKQSA